MDLMDLLQSLMSRSPDEGATNYATSIPAGTVPPTANGPDMVETLIQLLLQLVQLTQMQQSGQQSMNAVQGQLGGPFGFLGESGIRLS